MPISNTNHTPYFIEQNEPHLKTSKSVIIVLLLISSIAFATLFFTWQKQQSVIGTPEPALNSGSSGNALFDRDGLDMEYAEPYLNQMTERNITPQLARINSLPIHPRVKKYQKISDAAIQASPLAEMYADRYEHILRYDLIIKGSDTRCVCLFWGPKSSAYM